MFPREFRDKCKKQLREFITLPTLGFSVPTAFGAKLCYRIHDKIKYIVMDAFEYAKTLKRFGKITDCLLKNGEVICKQWRLTERKVNGHYFPRQFSELITFETWLH